MFIEFINKDRRICIILLVTSCSSSTRMSFWISGSNISLGPFSNFSSSKWLQEIKCLFFKEIMYFFSLIERLTFWIFFCFLWILIKYIEWVVCLKFLTFNYLSYEKWKWCPLCTRIFTYPRYKQRSVKSLSIRANVSFSF